MYTLSWQRRIHHRMAIQKHGARVYAIAVLIVGCVVGVIGVHVGWLVITRSRPEKMTVAVSLVCCGISHLFSFSKVYTNVVRPGKPFEIDMDLKEKTVVPAVLIRGVQVGVAGVTVVGAMGG